MRPAAAILAILAPAPALAEAPAAPVEWPGCYCTDTHGERRELGEETCLVVDGRSFMARCEMALNVTIWKATGAGCVSSSLERGPEAGGPVLQAGPVDPEVVLPEAQS